MIFASNKKNGRERENKPCRYVFFITARLSTVFIGSFPSAFLSVSCLPGVYLEHEDGALMMPQGCQYNQRAILFICTSCQKTKAYKLQSQRLQHELAPTPELSFHRVTGTKIRTKALSTQSDIVFE